MCYLILNNIWLYINIINIAIKYNMYFEDIQEYFTLSKNYHSNHCILYPNKHNFDKTCNNDCKYQNKVDGLKKNG